MAPMRPTLWPSATVVTLTVPTTERLVMFRFYTNGDSWVCERFAFRTRATSWQATRADGTVILASTKDSLTNAIRRHYV